MILLPLHIFLHISSGPDIRCTLCVCVCVEYGEKGTSLWLWVCVYLSMGVLKTKNKEYLDFGFKFSSTNLVLHGGGIIDNIFLIYFYVI